MSADMRRFPRVMTLLSTDVVRYYPVILPLVFDGLGYHRVNLATFLV